LASKAPGSSDNIEDNYNELAFSSTNGEEVSSKVGEINRKGAEDYWDDFSKFFMLFILHHDLNKDCRGAWELLPHNF